jgi:pimeloyl-ACP methyl ester carboxylesterase
VARRGLDGDAVVAAAVRVADRDFPDPMAEARAIAEATGGHAEGLEGVGHYPHLEVPGDLAERVAAFAGDAFARAGRG